MPTPRETFRALNGLRFVAAIAVVCYHYAPEASFFGFLPAFLRNVVESGPMALPFFYILSGFVLSHSYVDRLPRTLLEARQFWRSRVARLYPAYLCAFVLFIPIAYAKYVHHHAAEGVHKFIAAGLLAVSTLQAWTPLAQSWNGPSWSLSVEAFFYLIFPAFAWLILKQRRSFIGIILLAAWTTMMGLSAAHSHGLVPDGVWRDWIQNHPLCWTPMFLTGIFLYRFYPAWRETDACIASALALLSAGALIVLCAVANGAWRDCLIGGGAAPLIAVMILACSHPTAFITRIMGVGPLFELGAISYAVYIIQSPVWHYFQGVIGQLARHAGPAGSSIVFLLYIPFLIGLAFALGRWVERPLQAIMASPRPRQELSGFFPAQAEVEPS